MLSYDGSVLSGGLTLQCIIILDSADAKPCKCIVIVCRSERVLPSHGRVSLVTAPSGIWTRCSSACSHGAQIHGAWPSRWRREATIPARRELDIRDCRKLGTHERCAGRMGDQRNLEEWCRTVWGPRYVNEAHSGMLGWDGLRGVPEPASGHVECLRPNVTSPQHFSSHACCGCTYSTVHVDGSKGLLDMQIKMHGVAKDASCTDIVHPIAMPPCHPAMFAISLCIINRYCTPLRGPNRCAVLHTQDEP